MLEFVVVPARVEDAQAMAELTASVAEERDGIATEPPVDVEERAAVFARGTPSTIVAVADDRVVGMLHIEQSRFGYGELGMAVARDWRGRGVGAALVAEAGNPGREVRPQSRTSAPSAAPNSACVVAS